MHYIEFADLDVKRGYKAYKHLQQLRIERRLVKEELEQCTFAFEAVKGMDLVIPNLNRAKGEVQKHVDKNKEKAYYVRSKEENIFDDFTEQQEKYKEKLKRIKQVK